MPIAAPAARALFQGSVQFDDPEFHRKEITLLASRNAQPIEIDPLHVQGHAFVRWFKRPCRGALNRFRFRFRYRFSIRDNLGLGRHFIDHNPAPVRADVSRVAVFKLHFIPTVCGGDKRQG